MSKSELKQLGDILTAIEFEKLVSICYEDNYDKVSLYDKHLHSIIGDLEDIMNKLKDRLANCEVMLKKLEKYQNQISEAGK